MVHSRSVLKAVIVTGAAASVLAAPFPVKDSFDGDSTSATQNLRSRELDIAFVKEVPHQFPHSHRKEYFDGEYFHPHHPDSDNDFEEPRHHYNPHGEEYFKIEKHHGQHDIEDIEVVHVPIPIGIPPQRHEHKTFYSTEMPPKVDKDEGWVVEVEASHGGRSSVGIARRQETNSPSQNPPFKIGWRAMISKNHQQMVLKGFESELVRRQKLPGYSEFQDKVKSLLEQYPVMDIGTAASPSGATTSGNPAASKGFLQKYNPFHSAASPMIRRQISNMNGTSSGSLSVPLDSTLGPNSSASPSATPSGSLPILNSLSRNDEVKYSKAWKEIKNKNRDWRKQFDGYKTFLDLITESKLGAAIAAASKQNPRFQIFVNNAWIQRKGDLQQLATSTSAGSAGKPTLGSPSPSSVLGGRSTPFDNFGDDLD
ncbi:hypothetical protein J3R30DRAFT_60709 [Lentinula aciculospora]|uniref:Uncharacterized protein n=1 Tax=Lentinula aciculospora TaxID=153920 RepID=A0A9W9ATL6_9AGAR|nr:hypothetical protein J3R30DRAFT_60709 [Lentinula aciculospora]